MRRSLGNNFNCQSEAPIFYVSNDICAINEAYKNYEYIKTFVLRCTTIGLKQKCGHRSSRSADMNMMNLRWKSAFMVEIDQYWVVSRRSWECVIWRHSWSYIYIKHHTIKKYQCGIGNTWSKHRIGDVFLWLVSRKWLRNQGKLQTNVGNYMWKHSLPLIFTFNLSRGTSMLELFPVVVF